jgi:transcriptional adapter 2-alpha
MALYDSLLFVYLMPDVNLLIFQEQQLCCKNKIFPSSYLKMKEVLMIESMKGSQLKRSDAQRLLKGFPSKADAVFDLLLQMGWIQSPDVPNALKQS